jgi:hypothetical protein
MKTMSTLFALLAIFCFSMPATVGAAPEDAVLFSYNNSPGCQHTTSTNHFELGRGESVQLVLNLASCDEEYFGGLLYFGYKTTKNSSRPITEKDGVVLKILDAWTGEEVSYDEFGGSGGSNYVFLEYYEAGLLLLSAENTSNKRVKIRLRSSAGL